MFCKPSAKALCLALFTLICLPLSAFAGGSPNITVKKMPCSCGTYGETGTRSNSHVHWEATCPMNIKMNFYDDDVSLVGLLNNGRTVVFGVCDDEKYDWLVRDFGITGCHRPANNAASICSRDNKLVRHVGPINDFCPTAGIQQHQVHVQTGDRLELDLSAGGSGTFTACPRTSNKPDTDEPECKNGRDDDKDGVVDFVDKTIQFVQNGGFQNPDIGTFAVYASPGKVPNWTYQDSKTGQNYFELQDDKIYGLGGNQFAEVDLIGHPYRNSFTIPASYVKKSKQAVLSFKYSARNAVPHRCNKVKQQIGYYVRVPGSSAPIKLGTVSAFPNAHLKRPSFTQKFVKFEVPVAGNYTISFAAESACSGGYGMLLDTVAVNGSDEQCNGFDDPSENGKPAQPECNDGIDNDGDHLIDFPADPGCSSKNDDDETDEKGDKEHDCNDGKDNDWDGKIDNKDPQCKSKRSTDEYKKNQIFAETECVTLNKDMLGNVESVTAHLTPYNRADKTITVNVGKYGSRTNAYFLDDKKFTPVETRSPMYKRFLKGRREGRISVTFPGDSELQWILGIGGEKSDAVVDADTIQCRTIAPSVCRFQDKHGNEKLRWRYTNKTHFRPIFFRIKDLGVNVFDPPLPAGHEKQPARLEKGVNITALETDWIDGLTWHLAGKKAIARASTPTCSDGNDY